LIWPAVRRGRTEHVLKAETPNTRCGVVAIVGAPNAGKSTLVNALVGQKVAIVSPKAQTTRTRLMGVAIEGDAQTGAGRHARHLRAQAAARPGDGRRRPGAAHRADLIALVVDGKAGLGAKVPIIESLASRPERKWLILNKVDIAIKEKLLLHTERLNEKLGVSETYFVSAATGDGLPELKAALRRRHARGAMAFPRGSGIRRHRPDDRRRSHARAALSPAPCRAALCLRGRDREI
jgi:GTP-binding protein Era